ncbi:hypothetical protein Tco_1457307 [Tanacetum coccineum]
MGLRWFICRRKGHASLPSPYSSNHHRTINFLKTTHQSVKKAKLKLNGKSMKIVRDHNLIDGGFSVVAKWKRGQIVSYEGGVWINLQCIGLSLMYGGLNKAAFGGVDYLHNRSKAGLVVGEDAYLRPMKLGLIKLEFEGAFSSGKEIGWRIASVTFLLSRKRLSVKKETKRKFETAYSGWIMNTTDSDVGCIDVTVLVVAAANDDNSSNLYVIADNVTVNFLWHASLLNFFGLQVFRTFHTWS